MIDAKILAGVKMLKLRNLLYFLALYPDDIETQIRHEAAAALSRELFPTMAKALVWTRKDDGSLVAGDYVYKNGEAYWRDEGVFFDEAPEGYLYDVAAAKAACEAHHQAKLKEMLA